MHHDNAPQDYDAAAEVEYQERKLLHGQAKIKEAENAIRKEEDDRLEKCLAKWRRDNNEDIISGGTVTELLPN